jgi:hypothetical protein
MTQCGRRIGLVFFIVVCLGAGGLGASTTKTEFGVSASAAETPTMHAPTNK